MEPCKNCDRKNCPTLTMPPPLVTDAIVVRANARNDCIAHTVDWRAEAMRLRESQRWIPVTERVPEERAMVLFMADDLCDGEWKPRVVRFGYLFAGRWWESGSEDKVSNVRVWMPLPAPPEQATTEVK